jgi:DNA-binding GntR family transcriptional regulator
MSTEMSVCLTLSTTVEVHAERMIRDLRALLNAMRKGDADKAAAVLERHLAAGEGRLLARFDA